MGWIFQDWDFHAVMSPMPPTLKGHKLMKEYFFFMIFFYNLVKDIYPSILSYLEALYYFFKKSENYLENGKFLKIIFPSFF